ncbi:MAG: hypothetical protein WBG19_09630 [Thermoplasmata archaeon]
MNDREKIEAFILAGRLTYCPTVYLVRTQHGPDKWEGRPVEKPKRNGGGFGKMWARRRQLMGVKP